LSSRSIIAVSLLTIVAPRIPVYVQRAPHLHYCRALKVQKNSSARPTPYCCGTL
jgi:hypothetical protein